MAWGFLRAFSLIWLVAATGTLLPASAQQYGNGAVFNGGGETVIFHSFVGGQGNIVELDLNSGELKMITTDGRRDRWPALSPDENQLVFISQRTPPWKIYRVNRDGSDLRLLTEEEDAHLGASWSPDGKKIIYSKQNLEADDFTADLWIMKADGSDKTKLTDGAMWPTWDHRSNSVFFTTVLEDGNVALGQYDMRTGKRSVLTDGKLNATGAGLSPDGRHIYVSAEADGNRALHRIDTQGGAVVDMGVPAQMDSAPRVSPDGRFLLYGFNSGDGTEIYLLNLSSMSSRNLSQEFADQ